MDWFGRATAYSRSGRFGGKLPTSRLSDLGCSGHEAPQGNVKMPYSTNNGVRTHYEVSGEGPAMVLLHANPFDHNLFLYQIQHFSAYFTVIATDMRGYGRSDVVTTPFTFSDMADDVYAVCQQEGVTEAIVVGVSTGSGIALLMGLDRPDFCRAVILVGGGSGKGTVTSEELARPTPRMREYLEKGLDGYHLHHLEDLVTPEFAESELGRYLLGLFVQRGRDLGWNAEGVVEVLRARRGTDMSSRLGGMKVPTLVINGEFDGGRPGGERTARMTSGAVHKILPGAGHACCLEDPGAFDALVMEFLDDSGLLPTNA